jgi:hypothetical protein
VREDGSGVVPLDHPRAPLIPWVAPGASWPGASWPAGGARAGHGFAHVDSVRGQERHGAIGGPVPLRIFVESARAIARSATVAEEAWRLCRQSGHEVTCSDLPGLFKHDPGPGESLVRKVIPRLAISRSMGHRHGWRLFSPRQPRSVGCTAWRPSMTVAPCPWPRQRPSLPQCCPRPR